MAKKQNDDRMTITRKIALIPCASENPQWKNRMEAYLRDEYFDKKIKRKENQIKNTSKPEKKKGYRKELKDIKDEYAKFLENGIEEYTNDMVFGYTYDLVREAMRCEAMQKNYILSYMFAEMIKDDVAHCDNQFKWVDEKIKYCFRVKGSSRGSVFDGTDIESPFGSLSIQGYNIELKGKIKKFIKDGGLNGEQSIANYKMDSPFHMSNQGFDIVHEYENITELRKNIGKTNSDIFVNLGNGGVPSFARFRINFGHKSNKEELIATITRIFTGEYEIGGSSIQISKNKIILNLSVSIPKQKRELDEDTVVGVDLGIAVPAVCALNKNQYKKLYIGNGKDFIDHRTKFQNQRKQLQKALKLAKGGHGRKRKLIALERLNAREKNYTTQYCHTVSSKVVDYALKNNAKYINIENLKGFDSSSFVLRNWSFYKLQQCITYKAKKYGIEVRKINPAFTSQVCSFCGHWEKGQRRTQATFVCGNPNCKSHKLYTFNADYNAARNIAMSELFTNDKYTPSQKQKEKAADYYGIIFEGEIKDKDVA